MKIFKIFLITKHTLLKKGKTNINENDYDYDDGEYRRTICQSN
jgi:hypothetical protein